MVGSTRYVRQWRAVDPDIYSLKPGHWLHANVWVTGPLNMVYSSWFSRFFPFFLNEWYVTAPTTLIIDNLIPLVHEL